MKILIGLVLALSLLHSGRLQAQSFDASVTYYGIAIDNVLPMERQSAPSAGVGAQLIPIDLPPINLGAFQIVIVPGPGLAANPAALAAFERAADSWEARVSDPIVVTLNADLGNLGPGIIGSTGAVILESGYTNIRNQLVADSALDPDDAIVSSMPTAAQFSVFFPQEANPMMPTRTLSSSLAGTKANFKAIGFPGLDLQFGSSDGTITFNSTFSFDYDNSNGVGLGLLDFETTAAHEIGHALGFISVVDAINVGLTGSISPMLLDLYRFSNNLAGEDPATPSEFTMFARNLIPGEDTVSDFISDPTAEFRMSTGTPSSFPGVDGRQASHWKDAEITGMFIGLLDPTLATGVFYGPQDSDFRALDLIGYDIVPVPVPEPSSLGLLLVGAIALLATRRISRSYI